MRDEAYIKSVFRVGDGGKGFLVNGHIVTAAHCLPEIPNNLILVDRPYLNLVGPLDGGAAIHMEAVYVDAASDVAVLRPHDDASEEWDELIADLEGLEIVQPVIGKQAVKVLSLDNSQWLTFETDVRKIGSHLPLIPLKDHVASGMSGSPILTPDNKAIGLVSMNDMNPIIRTNITPWVEHVLCLTRGRDAS